MLESLANIHFRRSQTMATSRPVVITGRINGKITQGIIVVCAQWTGTGTGVEQDLSSCKARVLYLKTSEELIWNVKCM